MQLKERRAVTHSKGLDEMPSWLARPNFEDPAWLNTLLAKLWPFVSKTLQVRHLSPPLRLLQHPPRLRSGGRAAGDAEKEAACASWNSLGALKLVTLGRVARNRDACGTAIPDHWLSCGVVVRLAHTISVTREEGLRGTVAGETALGGWPRSRKYIMSCHMTIHPTRYIACYMTHWSALHTHRATGRMQSNTVDTVCARCVEMAHTRAAPVVRDRDSLHAGATPRVYILGMRRYTRAHIIRVTPMYTV